MPGGNTRTVIHVPPFPLTIVRGEGARLDRRRRPRVRRSPRRVHGGPLRALASGDPAGDPRRARRRDRSSARRTATRRRSPRRCASASRRSSSCASATRAPRRTCSRSRSRAIATGKPAIMVFEGGYHGGVFFFATADGSPINAPFPFVVAPYNDVEAAARLIAEHAHELAAVHRRAVAGLGRRDSGRARIPPGAARRDRGARRPARLRRGDDVAALRPAASRRRYGITPDLTTLGKYVGGGLAFGAFGGRRRPDEPLRPVAARRAAACRHVQQRRPDDGGRRGRPDPRLHRRGGRAAERPRRPAARPAERVRRAARDLPFVATGYGSLVGLHFVARPGAAHLPTSRMRLSCARCCTWSCWSTATRTRAAASSRSRCRSTSPMSTDSRTPWRRSSKNTQRSYARPCPTRRVWRNSG